MSEQMYELLKRKDAEIAALRELVSALRNRFAEAASEHAAEEAWPRAYESLSGLLYDHGFKSDGSWRGDD
jgi:hypothetical protein